MVGGDLCTGVSVSSDGFQLAQIMSVKLKACGAESGLLLLVVRQEAVFLAGTGP